MAGVYYPLQFLPIFFENENSKIHQSYSKYIRTNGIVKNYLSCPSHANFQLELAGPPIVVQKL